MVKKGRVGGGQVVQASFDIPIEDSATRAEFHAQDPERVQATIRSADAIASKRNETFN